MLNVRNANNLKVMIKICAVNVNINPQIKLKYRIKVLMIIQQVLLKLNRRSRNFYLEKGVLMIRSKINEFKLYEHIF